MGTSQIGMGVAMSWILKMEGKRIMNHIKMLPDFGPAFSHYDYVMGKKLNLGLELTHLSNFGTS